MSASTDRIDLHIHSTCSGGMLTPRQVVDLAKTAGLCAVALTDHDTVAGIPEALRRV
jgi:predicted metal-dependent phosphoesterase TrpH